MTDDVGGAEADRRQALDPLELRNRVGEARALSSLGQVEVGLGRHADAVAHQEQALALCEEAGDTAQPSYIMTDVMKEVLISEKDWSATPAPVRSACQVMANRITLLDRQLEHANAEREIYRTQMLDMKARLDAALAMLQLSVPVDTTFDPAETWLDDADTLPSHFEVPLDEMADELAVLRVVNKTVKQDQFV